MSSRFVDYVVDDLLGEVEGARAKAMFGGYGIYKGDVFFAIIADDELYYKADASTQTDFKALGSQPFQYSRKDKSAVTMSYWKLPAEILDDRERLAEWTERAVRVAVSGALAKKPASRRPAKR